MMDSVAMAWPMDELRRVAQAYPGGQPALALRMCKRPASLRAELLPPVGSTAKLGLLDAVEIMALAQSAGVPQALQPLDVIEAQFGRMAVPLPSADTMPIGGLPERVTRMISEFADVLTEITSASSDGRVTANELKKVRREVAEHIAALQATVAYMQQLHEGGKPAHERSAKRGAR